MKKWYIIKDNNHFGPYSQAELKDLFKKKQIQADTLLKNSETSEQFQLSKFIQVPKEPALFSFFKNLNLRNITFAALAFISFLGLGFFLSNWSQKKADFTVDKPAEVSPKSFDTSFKSLEKAYELGEFKWSFLKDSTHKKLWLFTNSKEVKDFRIQFISQNNKVLSHAPIKFSVSQTSSTYLTSLDSVSFQTGDQIIPGIYDYTLNIDDKTHKGEIILGAHSLSEIDKKITAFHKSYKLYKNTTTEDLKMKYMTLSQIALSIKNELDLLTHNYSKVKKKEFIQAYQKKYGAFFTSFVIENEKRFRALTKASSSMDTEMVSHYSTLSKMAKKLGYLSVEAMDEIEQKDKIKNSLKKFTKVIELTESKMQILTNKKMRTHSL